jgi:dephospho-CoA kinase
MKLFGITGGVGMGKSTSASLLERRGIAVVDTDRIARQLVEPGQAALGEIAAAFGPSILLPTGSLNRKELARRVFADAGQRGILEKILHPKIRQIWQDEVRNWRASGRENGAVIIPLLFEIGADSQFDAIICVACSTVSQFERLRERGWSRSEIKRRLEAQWPVEDKIARADFVVWTDTPLEAHAAQLEKLLKMPRPEASMGH